MRETLPFNKRAFYQKDERSEAWEAALPTAEVSGKTYTRSTFTIDSTSACTSQMRAIPYIKQDITVSAAELKNGYDLTAHSVYLKDVQTDITYFKADNIRTVPFPGTWNVGSSNYLKTNYGVHYAPTCNVNYADTANCFGYWYNPAWVGTDGALGWCKPYAPGGAVYFDPAADGYTVDKITEADFEDLDTVSVYGLVTAKNGDTTWYEVIKLNITNTDAKHDTKAVVFLGDSVCSSAQYCGDTKGVRNNYVINPVELDNMTNHIFTDGGWSNSGGWAYQYAIDHPDTMVYNYGIGGVTMGVFFTPENHTIPQEYADFKAAHPDAEVSAFVVEMTLNDMMGFVSGASNYGGEVASMPDFTAPVREDLKGTQLGAAVTLIQNIKAEYPNAQIIFLTPPERYDLMYGTDCSKEIDQLFIDLEKICKSQNIPVVDMWNKSGLHCSSDHGATWNTQGYSNKEGVHPCLQSYIEKLYPCLKSFMDDGQIDNLLFDCDWGERNVNTFTTAPAALTATYTGKALTFTPNAQAKYGTVSYKFYKADKATEIAVDQIVNAGTYYCKAFVAEGDTYLPLSSDYVAVTVQRAANAMLYEVKNGTVEIAYADGGTYRLSVLGQRAENSFILQPQALTKEYDGNPISAPIASAKFGTVNYTYYWADKTTEIAPTQIVNAGTYYYKASVAQSNSYEGLDSDFIAITVNKADNSLIADWADTDGVIARDYAADGCELPAAITAKTAGVSFTVKDAADNEVSKLVMGEYTLHLIGTANYNGLRESYTIKVNDQITVSTYDELVTALRNYYASPSRTAALTLYDARVTVPFQGNLSDWVMPDKQYAGTNYASYTPSNFKAISADGINLMGWFGTQNKFYTKYWTDTVSDGTNDVSTVTVNNSTCTSIMRTESCIRQELNISRSDLADGYALTNHSTYVEAVQSDIIYFRAANVEQNVTVSNTSYDIASGTYGNSVVKSPYATVAEADYQIAYWYGGAAANATPDNPNVSQLGWNRLYGAGGAVYFDPLPTGFNFATTTLTEADFADEDTITLYGLVTVPEASTGNWGWKAVVELTVNLVD